MNKQTCIASLMVLVSLSMIGCSSADESKVMDRPNVLLIISDDQSWTDFGFMGHEQIETPNLDKMSRESLCFTRGYATAPLCSPSLASMITGLYGFQHGITGNDPIFEFDGDKYSPEWRATRASYFDVLKEKFYENKLLPEYLSEVGYKSLQTGKWWLGSWQEAYFDEGMTHGDPARGGRHGDEGLEIGRPDLSKIYDFIAKSKAAQDPFFVWYAPFLPHAPHTPPEELLEKYLKKTDSEAVARYWAMCEWFDQGIGKLIDFLEAQNLTEETLVVFTTDNGWIQDPDKINRYADRSKRSPYEMGIRTPIMFKWPGKITPQFNETQLASNIDLVPTILGACNLTPEADLLGINLLDKDEVEKRKTIFAEAYAHDILDVNEPTRSLQYRIAIEYPWKLIEPDLTTLPDGNTELFNLEVDPFEMEDLSSNQPDRVSALKMQMDAWWIPSHLSAN